MWETTADNTDALRATARTLSGQRRYDEAIAGWEAVEVAAPADEEAATMIAALTIRRSRQRGGLETPATPAFPSAGTADTPRAAADPAHAFSAQHAYEEARRQFPDVQRTPIQQLEIAVREFPSRVELYLQLAPLYLEKGRLYDAERLLTKGSQTTGNEPRVRKLWEEVTLLRFDNELADARKRAQREDTTEAHNTLADLTARRHRVWGEILAARCEREPENAAHHFAFGVLRQSAGELRLAISSFAQAVRDPRHETAAAQAMGDCLRPLGDVPEAMQQYRAAMQSATQQGDTERKRRALAPLIELATSMKLLPLAERYQRELAEL
jgi:tetratricopeptide (TPR) repeat protein